MSFYSHCLSASLRGRESAFIPPFPRSTLSSIIRRHDYDINASKRPLHAPPALAAAQGDIQSTKEQKILEHPLNKKYPIPRTKPAERLSTRHFINLTNGVEALSAIRSVIDVDDELRFMRLQSSHCESGAYDKILSSLDDELIFSLACGRSCYVYDFTSRNKLYGVPRSLFLGLEFVRWSLAHLWFASRDSALVPDRVLVRGKNTVPFWQNEVMPYKISKHTKKKLRYYAPFAEEMGVHEINLFGVYGPASEIDGCKSLHTKMVREWVETSTRNYFDSDQKRRLLGFHGFSIYNSNASVEELSKTQNLINDINMN